jgi:basic membrane lipoprotein Med (substrate-binding protein (PBP1-ABC) superfamily)
MYESAYLCGVIAGMMTESNILGAVGAFPVPNVNSAFNAYKRGALSVNPKCKVKFSYIESWFDPVKAKEAALAQIAAGVDFIMEERDGAIQACQDKGVYAFGLFMDKHKLAPDTVVTCAVNDWAPALKEAFDGALSGNFLAKDYTKCFAEGGSHLAPYYNFTDKIPPEVKKKIAKLTHDIKEGRLVIPYEPLATKGD